VATGTKIQHTALARLLELVREVVVLQLHLHDIRTTQQNNRQLLHHAHCMDALYDKQKTVVNY